jgi:hypothetical protein
MKAKSIQYSIPDPCEKNWNEMTPEATGRFCGSCEKSVVDFTNMSDFSIVNYLEKHKHEKVCGRFTKPQLDRVYTMNQPVFAPTFDLRAVVLGLALTTFSAVHSFSQVENLEPIKIDTLINRHSLPIVMGWAVPFYNHEKEKTVSGTVYNSVNNFTLVTVTLKTAEGTILKTLHPDVKGRFKFDLYWDLNPAFIEVSGVGYEAREFSFSSLRSLNNIQVHLLDEIELIRGEVFQGDVKATEEDQILQKIEMGNVNIRKSEK